MNEKSLYQILKEKGCRMTPQRKIILNILLVHDQELLTAEALLSKAKSDNPAINATTVYRNLDLLNELELLYTKNQSDGSKVYKLICSGSHHHHIICTGCGKMLPIDYCPLAPALEQMVNDTGFTLEDHSLELYGLCPSCQKTTH